MENNEMFNDLVSKIYSAPINPDLWSDVLDGIAKVANARGSVLLIERNDGWIGWRTSQALEPQISKQIIKHTNTQFSIINNKMKADGRPMFLSDDQFFDKNEWLATPFMKEYGTPNGLLHASGTFIDLSNAENLMIFTIRDSDKPIFDQETLDILNNLRPHLARASMLSSRWGMNRITSMIEGISKIMMPAFSVNEDCTLIHRNDGFYSVEKYFCINPNNTIEFVSNSQTVNLKNIVKEVIKNIYPKTIPLRPKNTKPSVCHLFPVKSAHSDFFDLQNMMHERFSSVDVLILMSELNQNKAPHLALIQNLFDLTPSESKIASHIANGEPIDQIAASSGITRETVKSHLKKIYAKTGVNRQSELASVLSGITAYGELT